MSSHKTPDIPPDGGLDVDIDEKHTDKCVVITNIPPGTKKEDLTIYFQKPSNGGGEVDDVKMLEEGKAIVIFDEEKVAKCVLSREHKFDDAFLRLEPYLNATDNTDDIPIFSLVSAKLNPSCFTENAKELNDILIEAQKKTDIKFLETCEGYLVSGITLEQIDKTCLFLSRYAKPRPPSPARHKTDDDDDNDEAKSDLKPVELDVLPKLMTIIRKKVEAIERKCKMKIDWKQKDGKACLNPNGNDAELFYQGKEEFISLYQKEFQDLKETNFALDGVDKSAGLDGMLKDLMTEFSVVIEKTGEKNLHIFGKEDRVSQVIQRLKASFGNRRQRRPNGRPDIHAQAAMSPLSKTLDKGIVVSVHQGDITKVAVDVIVNAANERLAHGGGVAGAIVRQGGQQIQQESDYIIQRYGLVPVGQVVHTGPGDLPCKCIFHAVGPQWKVHGQERSRQFIFQACTNSFYMASKQGMSSIALPGISSGLYGVPKHICAEMMFTAAECFIAEAPSGNQLKDIRFINIDSPTYEAFRREFQNRFGMKIPTDADLSNNHGNTTFSTAVPDKVTKKSKVSSNPQGRMDKPSEEWISTEYTNQQARNRDTERRKRAEAAARREEERKKNEKAKDGEKQTECEAEVKSSPNGGFLKGFETREGEIKGPQGTKSKDNSYTDNKHVSKGKKDKTVSRNEPEKENDKMEPMEKKEGKLKGKKKEEGKGEVKAKKEEEEEEQKEKGKKKEEEEKEKEREKEKEEEKEKEKEEEKKKEEEDEEKEKEKEKEEEKRKEEEEEEKEKEKEKEKEEEKKKEEEEKEKEREKEEEEEEKKEEEEKEKEREKEKEEEKEKEKEEEKEKELEDKKKKEKDTDEGEKKGKDSETVSPSKMHEEFMKDGQQNGQRGLPQKSLGSTMKNGLLNNTKSEVTDRKTKQHTSDENEENENKYDSLANMLSGLKIGDKQTEGHDDSSQPNTLATTKEEEGSNQETKLEQNLNKESKVNPDGTLNKPPKEEPLNVGNVQGPKQGCEEKFHDENSSKPKSNPTAKGTQTNQGGFPGRGVTFEKQPENKSLKISGRGRGALKVAANLTGNKGRPGHAVRDKGTSSIDKAQASIDKVSSKRQIKKPPGLTVTKEGLALVEKSREEMNEMGKGDKQDKDHNNANKKCFQKEFPITTGVEVPPKKPRIDKGNIEENEEGTTKQGKSTKEIKEHGDQVLAERRLNENDEFKEEIHKTSEESTKDFQNHFEDKNLHETKNVQEKDKDTFEDHRKMDDIQTEIITSDAHGSFSHGKENEPDISSGEDNSKESGLSNDGSVEVRKDGENKAESKDLGNGEKDNSKLVNHNSFNKTDTKLKNNSDGPPPNEKPGPLETTKAKTSLEDQVGPKTFLGRDNRDGKSTGTSEQDMMDESNHLPAEATSSKENLDGVGNKGEGQKCFNKRASAEDNVSEKATNHNNNKNESIDPTGPETDNSSGVYSTEERNMDVKRENDDEETLQSLMTQNEKDEKVENSVTGIEEKTDSSSDQKDEFKDRAEGTSRDDENIETKSMDDVPPVDNSADSMKKDNNSEQESTSVSPTIDMQECGLCFNTINPVLALKICDGGHVLCKACFERQSSERRNICPTCHRDIPKFVPQPPNGQMKPGIMEGNLLGYEGCGTLYVDYLFPGGIQSPLHPNPGSPYDELSRRTFLPDNKEGREVLELLKKAFNAGILFTVGKSTISGKDNQIIFNADIEHKMNVNGGPSVSGYPDPDYLDRVKMQLKAKGIE